MPVKWEDVLAGGAGAVDELLFGIPEYVAKKIDRQAVEGWINKNAPAYHTGETFGTVGSMFVPIPGLGAIGAAGKAGKAVAGAAKAADVAGDVAKAAKGAKGLDLLSDLGRLAKRGAAEGAIESAVRGVTGEKKTEDILKDIQGGALFGAAGGAAGGLIGKGAKKLGERAEDIAGELSKWRKQYSLGSAGVTKRYAKQIAKDFAGPGAKGLGKFAKADDALTRAAKIIDEEKLAQWGADDRYFAAVRNDWDTMTKAFQKKYGDLSGPELFQVAAGKASKDIDELAKRAGAGKVADKITELAGEAQDWGDVFSFRENLDDAFKDTFNKQLYPKTSDAKAARDAVQTLRRGLDEAVADAAEGSGLSKAIIDKRRKNYIFDRGIANAFADEIFSPKSISAGSQTAMRLGTTAAAAGLGAATGETDEEKLKRALLGVGFAAGGDVLGGMLSKGQAKLATRAVAAAEPLAEALTKAAPKVGALLGKASEGAAAQVGARAASEITRSAREAAAPQTKAEDDAAMAGAEVGAAGDTGTPAYVGRVMEGLARYAASKGVRTESDEYKAFVQQVYQATGGFQPEAIGGILYQDPAERAAYSKALEVARRLKETLPVATAEGPGFLQREGEAEGIQRQAATDQLAALVGDVAKATGTEKAAKAELAKIMKKKIPSEQKEALIRTLLAAYGVDVDALYEMGVV